MQPGKTMKKGFTLIELLIVISIIGILSAIGLNAFEDSQGRARDSRRISDLESIKKALQLYYNDNGSYPVSEWFYSGSGTSWLTGLAPNYIKALPVDPVNKDLASGAATCIASSANCFQYGYYSGTWCEAGDPGLNATGQYILIARLESKPNNTSQSQRIYVNANGAACNNGSTPQGAWPGGPVGGLYNAGE